MCTRVSGNIQICVQGYQAKKFPENMAKKFRKNLHFCALKKSYFTIRYNQKLVFM